MNNNGLFLGFLLAYSHIIIALIGVLSSILSFFFRIWFDKYNRENRLLFEMIQTFEEWIVTIQSMLTIMYDDSSINKKKNRNSRNKVDFEIIIKSLSILDVKIEGLKKSKVLHCRNREKIICQIFSEISEIESMVSNHLIPLDCQLMRTNTDTVQYLDLTADLRLALRQATEKMENFQGLIYRAKKQFV